MCLIEKIYRYNNYNERGTQNLSTRLASILVLNFVQLIVSEKESHQF